MSDYLSHPGLRAGWIEVIVGSMFSGKTEELIRRLRRAQNARQRVQVFKPRSDNSYSSDHVTSHSDQQTSSTSVDFRPRHFLDQVADNTRVVGIDERAVFDLSLVEVCQKIG